MKTFIYENTKSRGFRILDIENTEALYLQDGNGYILDKEEMEKLIKGLQFTLKNYEKIGIIENNAEQRQNDKEAMEEHNKTIDAMREKEREKRQARKARKGKE